MNVIFIVLDTARAQSFSCYGYDRETTPFIDSLADKGVLFQNARSVSPWTLPSHASMFTGKYPSEHGAHELHKYLQDDNETIAEIFSEKGYQTVGFTNNSWVSEHFGMARGFQYFYKSWQLVQSNTDVTEIKRTAETKMQLYSESLKKVVAGNVFSNVINTVYGALFRKRVDDGADRTNRLIQKWFQNKYRNEAHYLLFINYLEPHLKYHPPKSFSKNFISDKFSQAQIESVNQDPWAYLLSKVNMNEDDFAILTALYDAEISYLDSKIQELFSYLDSQSLLDNTLVLITSDHGENIGEHNLMDHQYSLHDTLLKVPFIVSSPSVFSQKTINEPVETRDIFYMLKNVAGLGNEDSDLPPYNRNGVLVSKAEYLGPQPTLTALQNKYKVDVPESLKRSLLSVTDNTHKYIHASDEKHELYNLVDDPMESNNIYSTQEDVAMKLKGMLDVNKTKKDSNNESREIDPMIKKRLEKLGYL